MHGDVNSTVYLLSWMDLWIQELCAHNTHSLYSAIKLKPCHFASIYHVMWERKVFGY
jgi:hypothetical protein